jgi:hypothetical protein
LSCTAEIAPFAGIAPIVVTKGNLYGIIKKN